MTTPPKCPLCSITMKKSDVAPCIECGHLEEELEHFRQGQHEYFLCEPFKRFEIVLCDFCWADFGSISPHYFGLKDPKQNNNLMPRLQKIGDPKIEKGWVCKNCQAREPWLVFVQNCRNHFNTNDNK